MSWNPTTVDVVLAAIRVRHRNVTEISPWFEMSPDDLATSRVRDIQRQIRELVGDMRGSGPLDHETEQELRIYENGK